jgi:predicted LPLAT superfamily acyltransferase
MSEAARWDRIAEAGSPAVLRLLRFVLRRLGRRGLLALAWPASVFFALRRGGARRASQRYLERVAATPEGRAALGTAKPGLREVLRHFHEFSLVLCDRIVVWTGALDAMEFDHDGSERLFELARTGEGALLLGAHVGSLDLMGLVARRYGLKVNVIAFHRNAERINAFLESLGAKSVRLIELEPGSVQAAFEMRACIERGEFVVIMADRVPPGAPGRSEPVRFFGGDARFPIGPFLLAGVLGCPVYLAWCARTGDARYRTVLRPLAPAQRVRRPERAAWARELMGRYAERIEETCRHYPFQWFNFFDFWEEEAG